MYFICGRQGYKGEEGSLKGDSELPFLELVICKLCCLHARSRKGKLTTPLDEN